MEASNVGPAAMGYMSSYGSFAVEEDRHLLSMLLMLLVRPATVASGMDGHVLTRFQDVVQKMRYVWFNIGIRLH